MGRGQAHLHEVLGVLQEGRVKVETLVADAQLGGAFFTPAFGFVGCEYLDIHGDGDIAAVLACLPRQPELLFDVVVGLLKLADTTWKPVNEVAGRDFLMSYDAGPRTDCAHCKANGSPPTTTA